MRAVPDGAARFSFLRLELGRDLLKASVRVRGFIGKRCAWIVAMSLETAGAICPGAFFDKAQLVQIRGVRSSLACLWR